MNIDLPDRALLRDLAKMVADVAARPEIAKRRNQWVAHNSLRSTAPLICGLLGGRR